MLSRRGLIGTLLAAPVIVRPTSLMRIVVPKPLVAVQSSFTSSMSEVEWLSSDTGRALISMVLVAIENLDAGMSVDEAAATLAQHCR